MINLLLALWLFSQPQHVNMIEISGVLHLHPHAEIRGTRAANYQILIKEYSTVIAKTTTDANGFFKVLINEKDHLMHGDISEPDLDIYYIPTQNLTDTVFSQKFTHFNSGHIKIDLAAYLKVVFEDEHSKIVCPKCNQSDKVKDNGEEYSSGKTKAHYYCDRDKIRF